MSTTTLTKNRYSQQQTQSSVVETSYRLCRDTLTAFTGYTFRGYQQAGHLVNLDMVLEAVERGELKRVIIAMPPRHGKSEKVSVRFPAWFLGRNPDKRVVISSYAADLAVRFSRQVRTLVQSERYAALFPDVKLAQDSRSAEQWDIAGRRGGLKAVGVGGPLTGHGANVLVIDDPLKNREEANSALIRQNVWDWYTSTAYTRLEDGGAVVVCMTRWHEDDLVGRLLEAQQEPQADQWHVVHMPAIDETGAALWPSKYDITALESIRANIGEYDWNALYQGRPTPREGSFFKVAQVGIVDVAPAGLRACRGWDLAATEGAGDYTVGPKLEGPDAEGFWYWTDMTYGRWDASTVRQTIRQTAEIDGRGVIIRLPQDPGQAGKDQARQLITMLSGFSVRSMPVSGSKEVRAAGFASQVNAGNVKMVKAPWNRFALDCLRSFPLGAVDDPIDAVSDAFNELTGRREVGAASFTIDD
jgi:predicted phage terminase large subunit-like protein